MNSPNPISLQLAKHIRDVHFGGNWTVTNLKEVLADVDWQTATTAKDGCNSIVALVYHMHYFVKTLNMVLEENKLEGHDKFSFDHPKIESEEDWKWFLQQVWLGATKAARLLESCPDSKLLDDFIDKKYGNYYRNIAGIIEHTHYHLGQIVILKKMTQENEK